MVGDCQDSDLVVQHEVVDGEWETTDQNAPSLADTGRAYVGEGPDSA